jgi:ANTAR domain
VSVDDGRRVVARLLGLCRLATRTLPASGAVVSVMTGSLQAVAASTDALSERLDTLQTTLGEGPAVDALALRRPVLEPDLQVLPHRWAGYSPAAIGDGVRGAFAFPLQIGAAQLGVLTVYRRGAGSLSRDVLTRALTLADRATGILLDGQADAGPARPPRDLESALEPHYVVYQAQGMTMVDLGVLPGEAMARLRAYAYAHDRPLREVAADVVAGTLRLERDQP